MQHILTSKQKYFSFVFKYSKRPCPMTVGCVQTNNSIKLCLKALYVYEMISTMSYK